MNSLVTDSEQHICDHSNELSGTIRNEQLRIHISQERVVFNCSQNQINLSEEYPDLAAEIIDDLSKIIGQIESSDYLDARIFVSESPWIQLSVQLSPKTKKLVYQMSIDSGCSGQTPTEIQVQRRPDTNYLKIYTEEQDVFTRRESAVHETIDSYINTQIATHLPFLGSFNSYNLQLLDPYETDDNKHDTFSVAYELTLEQ
jgi:hypothetical protein